MATPAEPDTILIQLVAAEPGREIGWDSPITDALSRRVSDVKRAVQAGVAAMVPSLDSLPSAKGWHVDKVQAEFGIALRAEGGVLLTRGSVGATFDVSVTFSRVEPE